VPKEKTGMKHALSVSTLSVPAFAMTINKAQGQTFKRVGVYLPDSVFTHGQLYVALSRVGNPDALKVMVKPSQSQRRPRRLGLKTGNVVYREVFRDA
jgi:hypothetical protein